MTNQGWPNAPMPHYPQQPAAYQRPPRTASGLGITGMVLGCIAILGAWVPLCGFATLPLSIIGLIFAGIGLILSLGSGGQKGLGAPIMGCGLCLVAIILPFVMTAVLAAVGGDAQKRAEAAAAAAATQPGATRPATVKVDRPAQAVTPSAAPTAPPAKPRSELEGFWNQTNGRQVWQYEFRGDQVVLRSGPKGIETGRGGFKLDASTTPKRIDLEPEAMLGIYKLEGGTLTVCLNGASVDRPTKFDDAGGKFLLYTFKKVGN